MKIAMISNCSFLEDDKKNGWEKEGNNEIFISQYYLKRMPGYQTRMPVLWEELVELLPIFEKIIFRLDVGMQDKLLIELSKLKVPSEKIIIVSCSCLAREELELLIESNYYSSRRIFSDCSGYDGMNYIYRHFLEEGKLPE